jgi:membrane protease YdiL (CAAX protease family)
VRPLGKIFLYLVLVLLGGSLAAPQAWHLVQTLPPEWFGGLIAKVQGMPFHRYFSRSVQVAALVLIWPLMKSLRVRSLREFGLVPDPRPFRDLGAGVISGLFGMALFSAVQLLSGASLLDPAWVADLQKSIPRVLLTATAVSVLEEFLFRGVLFGFFRQFLSTPVAVLLSSVAFAGIHFAGLPADGPSGIPPHWWSGLAMVGRMIGGLAPTSLTAHAFLILFTAGVILAWLTIRTGSLWAPVGLHAAWIFGQQTFNSVAMYFVTPLDGLLPLIGPSQCKGMVPTGLLPFCCLLIAGFLAFLLLRKREHPPVFAARGF